MLTISSQRGVGDKAVGCSVSLVSPKEDKIHNEVVRRLVVRFQRVFLDSRLLTGAQERVGVATKIVAHGNARHREQREAAWFKEQADEMGVELDDDMKLDTEASDNREATRQREAKQAKGKLAMLLREPLQIQRFGKFLSTNSAGALHQLRLKKR